MKRAYGQALVELTLAMSVLAVALVWALPLFHDSLQQRYHGQQILGIHLQQQPLRAATGIVPLTIADYQAQYALVLDDQYELTHEQSSDYRFAKAISPLWKLLSFDRDFSLPLNNLEQASLAAIPENSEQTPVPWLSYLRLTNGWAPRSLNELVSRPQALTTTQYLNQLGFQHLQQLVGVLPFAREFSHQNLRLGYVNADVVPSGSLCSPAGREC